jgi:ABC-type sugar transport system ATPase subunit
VLEVSGITMYFGAVRALHDVSVSVGPGEVLGLVGDNGAGKSTLVNILAGVLRPDHGTVAIRGERVALGTPAKAKAMGIETVFQSLSLVPNLDIAENVFLHREIYGPGPILRAIHRMDKARMRSEVADGFRRLGVSLPSLRTKVTALSGGQRQAVAIARAVLWQQNVVLLDEPAAALGVRQTEMVLSFVERLKEHGVAVILISHNLQHVARVADRVVVLRLGEKVFDSPLAQTSNHEIVLHITGAVSGDTDVHTEAVLRAHQRDEPGEEPS